MTGFFDKLMRGIRHPSLDWIQIEVASMCRATCFYCPRTVYRDHWNHGVMDMDTFRAAARDFRMAELIYLQGWGEPFLNRNLFEMIETAKAAGRKVGLTTNGMFLNRKNIDALMDLKLDILGVSLAGLKPATHNRFRSGTDLERITNSLLDLKERKAEKRSDLPHVHLAYLMLRSNFEDLREIVPYAQRVDSREIVASNLNFFPGGELRKEALFLDEGKTDYYRQVLEDIRSEAKKNGVNFFFYSPVLQESPLPSCPENILKSCFISHDGSVSSCVFTNLPLLEQGGGDRLPERVLYGNIRENTLAEIWDSEPYRFFRKVFAARQKSALDIDLLLDIDRVRQEKEVKKDQTLGDAMNDLLPVQCRQCYRIFGV